ncbi:MAG: hydroxymethylglutaryl-CoA lyase [Planctomycetota bacterium]|jgi:hydroxymethylglutaryl-CoA lyase
MAGEHAQPGGPAVDPGVIRITEVGARDGLQNEAAIIDIADKVRFIDLISESGVAEIEVSSFVSPRWVPQLADADEVFRRIRRRGGVGYSALVPNELGAQRALEANVDKIAVMTAASETFSRKNTNATIEQTMQRAKAVIKAAHGAGLPVRAYISCAVACPYEGGIDPATVRDLAAGLLDLGADEVDLADTIGVAVPDDIDALYEGLAGVVEPGRTTLHLHDTRGTALACAMRGAALGVASFDASCAGLGGCPFAPGAAGNMATEDLVYLCDRMGWRSGVDLDRLLAAGRHIAAVLGRPMRGRVFSADGGDRSQELGVRS